MPDICRGRSPDTDDGRPERGCRFVLMNFLTVKEVAELKGCSVQYLKKLAKDGRLEARQEINPQNNRMQYLIPLAALPEDVQSRYYSKIKSDAQLCLPKVQQEPIKKATAKKEKKKREFGDFSADEREQIQFWSELIREWRIRRQEYETLAEADMCFIAEIKRVRREYLAEHGIAISKDILYRKYKAYKDNDLEGLVDNRGAWNKGSNEIPSNVLDCFYYLYLDDRENTVSECYRMTMNWAKEYYPEYISIAASERTFRRQVDKLPLAAIKYFREGKKEFLDDCAFYIERLYDGLEANDVWVADNHTFDFITLTDDGERKHRLYITGILDAKSGVLVGWNITEKPCSQSTVLALRHAIMRCGIPGILYVDNGTEFLTHDIGGKGHRARKSQANIPNPPTILDRLGIKMVNANVCNGRAKPIERVFLTLKNTISRIVSTFVGGNIIERPESLKWQLKNGIIPYDHEIREQLDILFDGQYNASQYGGGERQFKGMSRIDVWNKSIKRRTMRMCDESTLSLLLMRTTRYQKVRENGVYITISGEKLWFNCGEDNWRWVGQEVYVRYDPACLDTVRVYDKEDRYIGSWGMDLGIFVDYITSNNDDIAARQTIIARQLKAVKKYGEEITGGMKIDALALAVTEAHRIMENGSVKFNPPTCIEPVIIKEEPETLKKAVGAENVDIDLKTMAQNAAKRSSINLFNFEED